MIAGADQLGGASDDWESFLDGIVGAIKSGMVVRGGQGGTEVTAAGVGMTEMAEGGVKIAGDRALQVFWHDLTSALSLSVSRVFSTTAYLYFFFSPKRSGSSAVDGM